MVKELIRLEHPDLVIMMKKKGSYWREFVKSLCNDCHVEWIGLRLSGDSGGILLLWNSKVLKSVEEVGVRLPCRSPLISLR